MDPKCMDQQVVELIEAFRRNVYYKSVRENPDGYVLFNGSSNPIESFEQALHGVNSFLALKQYCAVPTTWQGKPAVGIMYREHVDLSKCDDSNLVPPPAKAQASDTTENQDHVHSTPKLDQIHFSAKHVQEEGSGLVVQEVNVEENIENLEAPNPAPDCVTQEVTVVKDIKNSA